MTPTYFAPMINWISWSCEINVELVNIHTWVRVNKLSLNIEKTKFMLFTPNDFSRNMNCINIDGHRIEEVRQTKFLGVILDNKLNWHAHCEYICGKMFKGIGIIVKARKVFNETTLLSLYNSLILPYVSYCIHVWGKAYDTHLKHVLVFQNKAVRIIAGVPPRTSADNLYLELDILPVKKIFVHAKGIFMYKYVNRMLPELFLDMFTPVSEIHNYDARQALNKNLFVSFKSTSRGQQSITYIGPHVWNFILSKINPYCSIGSFKTYSSIITALICVRFDVVITDIITMITSSNGNIFRVTGPLCGGFTGPGEFPAQGPVTRSFDVFFDLRRNKRLSKQPWGWWFKMPSWSLWRQCHEQKCSPYLDLQVFIYIYAYRSICFIYIYMHMYICYFYFI